MAGVDLPMAACLIDARPTKSRIRYVQVIGRGLRTSPGKADLRILDHAGNALRLGLVTDIHQTCLDDGEEKAAAAQAARASRSRVPSCARLARRSSAAAERVCFACGEPVRVLTTVREIEGDLVELGSRRSGQREIPEWERRRFYSRTARDGGRARLCAGLGVAQVPRKIRALAQWLRPGGDVAVGHGPQLGSLEADRFRQGARAAGEAPQLLRACRSANGKPPAGKRRRLRDNGG